jgi:hypothetical protein
VPGFRRNYLAFARILAGVPEGHARRDQSREGTKLACHPDLPDVQRPDDIARG